MCMIVYGRRKTQHAPSVCVMHVHTLSRALKEIQTTADAHSLRKRCPLTNHSEETIAKLERRQKMTSCKQLSSSVAEAQKRLQL